MKEITADQVKSAIENPDYYNGCDKHLIRIKNIDGRLLAVYCEVTGDKKADVVCAGWLSVKEHDIKM